MDINDKVLLLRYSDFHGVDTISAHREVVEKNGCCWWAKIGKQPSEKYITEIKKQKRPYCLLYTPGMLHLCELGDIIERRPDKNYPKYYETDIFGIENEPRVYFELLSIEKIELSFLEDYIVSSSEKEVLYDLKKTISSYMLIQHKNAPRKPKVIRKKKEEKKKESENKNDCIYRKNGMCNNRRCINYQYECLRPQMCFKQKLK